MASTLTPNMSLVAPTIGSELSPQWAADLNSSLTLVDQHNHTNGQGVAIPVAGLNINTDLPLNTNNLTLARAVRFSALASTGSLSSLDNGSISEVGVDLYYRDGNGNNIRMTQSGSVAGASGSITNLSSPASVTYVSATPAFVFQSAASTSANLDGGSLTIRQNTASANGVTLSSPAGLSASYSLTMPSALPGATSFLTIGSSGNIASGVATANGITRANLASVGQQISSSCGNFSTGSTSFVSVTNLSVTLTTTGRPVMVFLQGDGSANGAFMGPTGATTQQVRITRDGTEISRIQISPQTQLLIGMPMIALDIPSAASHTYVVQTLTLNGTVGANIAYYNLVVYEL